MNWADDSPAVPALFLGAQAESVPEPWSLPIGLDFCLRMMTPRVKSKRQIVDRRTSCSDCHMSGLGAANVAAHCKTEYSTQHDADVPDARSYVSLAGILIHNPCFQISPSNLCENLERMPCDWY